MDGSDSSSRVNNFREFVSAENQTRGRWFKRRRWDQNASPKNFWSSEKSRREESSETPPELWGMLSPSVDYPCLTVCLPKCFLTLRAGPDLNCFRATDAFLSGRKKRNIADEQMCFKNGRGTRSPRGGRGFLLAAMKTRLDVRNTQGGNSQTHAWAHMYKHTGEDVQGHANTLTLKFWIFYAQIIKERWVQTEETRCCLTPTTAGVSEKGGCLDAEQVSSHKNTVRHTFALKRSSS